MPVLEVLEHFSQVEIKYGYYVESRKFLVRCFISIVPINAEEWANAEAIVIKYPLSVVKCNVGRCSSSENIPEIRREAILAAPPSHNLLPSEEARQLRNIHMIACAVTRHAVSKAWFIKRLKLGISHSTLVRA